MDSILIPIIGGNIFFPMADNQMFSVFVSKVQNEQGIDVHSPELA